MVNVQSRLCEEVQIGNEVKPCWVASKKGIYTCAKTWDAIRSRLPIVTSWNLVWHYMAIPKYSFMFWLAMKDCLTTGEEASKMGLQRGCVVFIL